MQRMYLPHPRRPRQRGVALFVVIVFVMLSMLLALWASRTSLFSEMVVGNDADYQRAFEAAQALLQDAELDIRGENPDGSPCTAAKCRDKIGTAEKIPLDPQEVTPLLADLDQKPTKCSNGLCLKRSGRQDFWNKKDNTGLLAGEVALADMTKDNVGARYGDYTNATLGSTSAPANLSWKPACAVAFLPSSRPRDASTLGAAQMAATFLPLFAKETQVSVTVLLAARFGVPGMPPGSTTMSTSE